MPRIARKNLVASYIHIITQGINKEKIFRKSEYKKEYIKLIKQNFQTNDKVYLLSYCIMDNHTHLLIYTENYKEVSKIMAKINTSYAIFYNKIEDRIGYVFRDRYYIQPIKDEIHLYTTIVYIHKNPVKANMVKEMDQYLYSSYLEYLKGEIDQRCIEILFHTTEYKERFDLIHKNIVDRGEIADIEKYKANPEEIKKWIDVFCQKVGVKKEEIKENNSLILQIMQELKSKYSCNNKEITEILGIGKNRITRILKRKKRLKECPINLQNDDFKERPSNPHL